MGLKSFNASQFVSFLIWGAIFIAIIASVINFAAINNPDVDLLKPVTEGTGFKMVQWIIVGMALWLVWTFIIQVRDRWDRKKLVSFVLTAIVLYYAYTILNGLGVMPDLELAAMQLQAMLVP